MLKPFNDRRTLVEQETMLVMPVMGGKYIYLGYQMWKSTGNVKRRRKSLST